MKHWKCSKCHHEWDGDRTKCDWCDNEGIVLADIPLFDLKLFAKLFKAQQSKEK